MVDDLGITILYTAPTALRAIAQAGDEHVKRYSRRSLRILGSVGEPINPEDLALVSRRGRRGTLRGRGHVVADGDRRHPDLAAAGRDPDEAGLGDAAVVRGRARAGRSRERSRARGQRVSGALCLAAPWPGQARTVWGDHQRFKETYFTQYKGVLLHG
jgi:acetyl-CoA synthetase